MVEGEITNKELLDFITRQWGKHKKHQALSSGMTNVFELLRLSFMAQQILETRRTNKLLEKLLERENRE